MDLKELTNLLVESSEQFCRTRFIPWWEEDPENPLDEYSIFPKETVEDAERCVASCEKEELLAPVGNLGLSLFHLLVWHHFYRAVESILQEGKITKDAVDTPDGKGQGLTPFLLACAQGNLKMVKLLLAHGARDSLCDGRGRNAYHFLAYPCVEDLAGDSSCLDHSVEQREDIARLLSCDINQKNNAGLTPLELLLSSGYCSSYTWPLTEVFLEKGARTDYVDQDGNTLLMLARRNGHITAALCLMERCPEMLNTANKAGVTPVSHAMEYQNMAMYIALTDYGAAPADPPMELFPLSQIASNAFCYVSENNKDGMSIALYLTRKLIHQADPDDDDELGQVMDLLHNGLIGDRKALLLDTCKEAGFSFTMPLHSTGEALCLRDKCLQPFYGINVLRKLTQLGVDLDSAVIKGRTPANILASKSYRNDSYFEEATRLFSRESMEQTNNQGMAAVHLAAQNGHTGMLKVMLEKGVDVNLTTDEPGEAGLTPLHLACIHGNTETVRLLMAAGADDTLTNLKGETPAHLALLSNRCGEELNPSRRAEILRELKHLDIPREDGQTPLMLLNYRILELLPIFIERGADVNHRDQNGMTALMHCPDKDMAKELLKAGADLNLADNEGNTALHHALENGDEGSARYLIKKGADYNKANNRKETPAQIAAENGYEMVLELMTDIEL